MQPPMYQPPAVLYDDDPGIMSEVETSATGLRRGTKARSSLPIVRTPNKTNERPLGELARIAFPIFRLRAQETEGCDPRVTAGLALECSPSLTPNSASEL